MSDRNGEPLITRLALTRASICFAHGTDVAFDLETSWLALRDRYRFLANVLYLNVKIAVINMDMLILDAVGTMH